MIKCEVEVSCVPLQQTLRHLQVAFTNFWAKRAKYPRFKKKRNGGNNHCHKPPKYKCQWYGRELVKIDRFFPSSKRCGNCGFVIDKLPLKIREWSCPEWGTIHDRDINAAKNILAAGLAVTVCGANVRPARHSSKGQSRKTRKRKKLQTQIAMFGNPPL